MCYTIDEIKSKTIPVAKSYGISKLSLFGSYARGEATDDSDIDFCIDKGKIKGLLRYFSFVNELETIFQCHVDVVTSSIEDKAFLGNIIKEGIVLYEEW